MGLPGWGQVAGIGASLVYRFLDPRRKRESLLDEKEKILRQPQNDRASARLAWIDGELLVVQREIDRRAG